jgi:hypothetical protein
MNTFEKTTLERYCHGKFNLTDIKLKPCDKHPCPKCQEFEKTFILTGKISKKASKPS